MAASDAFAADAAAFCRRKKKMPAPKQRQRNTPPTTSPTISPTFGPSSFSLSSSLVAPASGSVSASCSSPENSASTTWPSAAIADTKPVTKSLDPMESFSAVTSTPSTALTRKERETPPVMARRASVYSTHPASSQTLRMTTELLLTAERPLPCSTLATETLNALITSRVTSSFEAMFSFMTALTTSPTNATYGLRSCVRRIGYSVIVPVSGRVTVMQRRSPSVVTVACIGTPGLLSPPPFETSVVSNFERQIGMFGSFLRHVRTVPPFRPSMTIPLPISCPTISPAAFLTTSYCSHLFWSPPMLRRE
mmetsp:Transcript_9682/g.23597  ORF Transcript_9682/g.23597 Transcript_9682/m.23597 type:complete len:308 (+) Transcript_9682:360-1283(+)